MRRRSIVDGLRKRYDGHEVVRRASASRIRPASASALLGPNGAGKTTTLRCCLGLDRPRRRRRITCCGDCRCRGHARAGAHPAWASCRRWTTSIPTSPSARTCVVYGRYFGLARRRDPRPHPAAARVRRAGRQGAGATIGTLSGRHEAAPDARPGAGQRPGPAGPRRADHRPRPAGAPPDLGAAASSCSRQGKTILLTTHFMDEAERLCHRLAIIDRGRLIAQGTPARAHRRPHRAAGGRGLRRGRGRLGRTRMRRARRSASRSPARPPSATCDDAKPLIEDLEARPALRYLHRPANLEDVFLKLTGRELRD
ncbi:MAG: hypothetical protein MZV65_44180 [Chromatiales bacterium]|nr:hypothetical protein [Chromatiales bacterium]